MSKVQRASLGSYRLGPNSAKENGIYQGDFRILGKDIPNDSVDLILTDPPYAKEYIPLYGDLAELGARVLKPGGFCLALCGIHGILEAMNLMGRFLNFFWMGGISFAAAQRLFYAKKIWMGWRPVLWFVKSGLEVRKSCTVDWFVGQGRDKTYHPWGQSIRFFLYHIIHLTLKDDVVLDPFVGGGTTPAACKRLGRRYLAFDIDPNAIETSRKRLDLEQVQVVIPKVEQMSIVSTIKDESRSVDVIDSFDDYIIDVRGAAKELGYHFETVRIIVHKGDIAAKKIKGKWMLSRIDFDRFKARHVPVVKKLEG